MDSKEIGDHLTKYRQAAGLTLPQAAEFLCTTQKVIFDWEDGNFTTFHLTHLPAISMVYHVPLIKLVTICMPDFILEMDLGKDAKEDEILYRTATLEEKVAITVKHLTLIQSAKNIIDAIMITNTVKKDREF